MKTKIIFFMLCFCHFFMAQNAQKLDLVYDQFEKFNKGFFTVAVQKEGKEVYFRTVGYSDYENEKKADENTKYRIASISKVFTSVLVFKAIEEGKLKQNTKVSQYFPNIENAKDITISNLLQHTSGIKNIAELKNYESFKTKPVTKSELLAAIEKLPSDFPPGMSYHYSNTGFSVLAFILEKVYNQDFEQILQEKITSPLGMKNTGIGHDVNALQNEAKSYVYSTDYRKYDDNNLGYFFGSAQLISTPQDLNTFFTNLFSGNLLSKSDLVQMKNLSKGMMFRGVEEYNGFGHSGNMGGFISQTVYFPAEQLSVSVIENGVRYDINEIADYAIRSFLGKDIEVPDFSPYQIDFGVAQKYVGQYKNSLSENSVIDVIIENKKLFLQINGKLPMLYIEPKSPTNFKYDRQNTEVEFTKDGKKLIIFTKDKKKFEYLKVK